MFKCGILPSPPEEVEQGGGESVSSPASEPEINVYDASYNEVANAALERMGESSEDSSTSDQANESEDSSESKDKPSDLDHTVEETTLEQMMKDLQEKEKSDDDPDAVDGEKSKKTDEMFVLKHDGEVQQYNREKTIELAQKGLDYTKKTQAIAEREKQHQENVASYEQVITQKTEELQKSITEHQTSLTEFENFKHTLQKMKESDPDTLEVFAEYYKQTEQEQNTPAARAAKAERDMLKNEIAELKELVKTGSIKQEDELIKRGYHLELEAVKRDVYPQLIKLGITPNEEAMKQAWIAGEKENKTLVKACYEAHGEQIAKLHASKQKLKHLENKQLAEKMRTVGGLKGSRVEKGEIDLSKLNWNEVQDLYARA